MDAAQCKEHHSTCPQSVWDATTVDIHHDAKVPNTWWAAEDTQPRVHNHLQAVHHVKRDQLDERHRATQSNGHALRYIIHSISDP